MKILVWCLLLISILAQGQEDATMTPEQLATEFGFPNENHLVQAQDGFLISLFRVYGNSGQTEPGPNGPVFLIPSIASDSATLLRLGADSVPFTMAEEGYDVWMLNTRATKSGRAHVDHSPDGNPETCLNADPYDNPWELGWINTYQYFNFSYDTIADDIMQAVQYITETTGFEEIPILCTSLGCTYLSAGLDIHSDYFSQHVTVAILDAPAVEKSHSASMLINSVADMAPMLAMMDSMHYGLLSTSRCAGQLMRYICGVFPGACMLVDFSNDYDISGINWDAFMEIFQMPFPGITIRILMNVAQDVWRGHFSRFDFGAEENLLRYGSETAPNYDLSNVGVPVALIFSGRDVVVTAQDAQLLTDNFGENVVYSNTIEASHGGISYGNEDALGVLVPEILDLLSQYPAA